VSNFRGGIDEFEVDLLQILPLIVGEQWVSEHDRSLPDSHAGSFDDQKFIFDLTIMRESTQWGNRLLRQINGGSSLILDGFLSFRFSISFSDPVDLFVDLHAVMKTFLPSTSDSITYPRWMPSSDTRNFPQTTMRLPREFFGTPSGSHTFSSMSASDSDAVNVLVHREDVGNWERFFE